MYLRHGGDKGKPCLHTATASAHCTVRAERGREGGSLGIREGRREKGNRKALVGAILLHSTSAKREGGSSRCLQSCNSSGTLGLAQVQILLRQEIRIKRPPPSSPSPQCPTSPGLRTR